MGYFSENSEYIADYIADSLFMGGTTQSPNHNNSAGVVWMGLYTGQGGNYNGDDAGWQSYEMNGNSYARLQLNLSYSSSDKAVSVAGPISFTAASPAGWGFVQDFGIYNTATRGTGDAFVIGGFDCTPFDWDCVGSVTIGAGERVTIPNYYWSTFASGNWRIGQQGQGGLVGLDYCGSLMRWIYNFDSSLRTDGGTPIPGTYQLAVGRYTTISDYVDAYGRLLTWTECSGEGYNRIPLSTSDWGYTHYGDNSIPDVQYMTVYNKYEITFTSYAQSDWGLINMFVLYPTGFPNMPAWYGIFNTPITVLAGNAFSIYPTYLRVGCRG